MAESESHGCTLQQGQIRNFQAHKNIFREGELDKRSVVAKYATTASDGKTYQVEYFNLDVMISGFPQDQHRSDKISEGCSTSAFAPAS